MSSRKVVSLSAHEIAEETQKGALTPLEVTEHFLDHIEELNTEYNAFIAFDRENALEQAQAVQQAELKDKLLLGVPIAVSDRCSVKGLPSTLGSKFLESTSSEKDSNEVKRLKDSGAIIIGKTNCSEFFITPYSDNIRFGKSLNPWGKELTAGGAEAGAAVAVASGMCPLALAIDGLGSIRLSSSYCGVLGLKPTRGLIPLIRPNQVPFSHRYFCQLGPIFRHVEDAARVVDILGQYDCRDALCVQHKDVHLEKDLAKKPQSLRISYCLNDGYFTAEKEIEEMVRKHLSLLKEMGHHVEEVSLGLEKEIYTHAGEICFADNYLPILNMIESGERSWAEMSPYTKTWLLKGKEVTGVGYSLALAYVEWLHRHIDQIFDHYDLIVTPTVSHLSSSNPGESIHPQFGLWSHLLPFNLSGHPAVSIPIESDSIPYGIQLVAPFYQEQRLLSLAEQIQENHPFKFPHIV